MKFSVLFVFTLGALLSNSELSAHCCWTKDNPGFYDLQVAIKNLGVETCNLEQALTQQGTLYGSNIPLLLPADGQVFSFTMSGKVVDISLTYTCGNSKKITLNMKQYLKKNHNHTSIEAYTTNVVDVFEQHTTKVTNVGCCSSHNHYGAVSWDLSH